jgi:hypothetical protein
MSRKQAQNVGLIKGEYAMKSNIVECIEKGRYCQGKFIITRVGQTDTCMKCMEMFDGVIPRKIEIKGDKMVI